MRSVCCTSGRSATRVPSPYSSIRAPSSLACAIPQHTLHNTPLLTHTRAHAHLMPCTPTPTSCLARPCPPHALHAHAHLMPCTPTPISCLARHPPCLPSSCCACTPQHTLPHAYRTPCPPPHPPAVTPRQGAMGCGTTALTRSSSAWCPPPRPSCSAWRTTCAPWHAGTRPTRTFRHPTHVKPWRRGGWAGQGDDGAQGPGSVGRGLGSVGRGLRA